MEKGSGLLLHVSSLPSKHGIGTFGREAHAFIKFLVKSKQKYWQMLPLNPTSYGDSPYQSFSAFALNPYFIDLDILVHEELLTKKEVKKIKGGSNPHFVDYGKVYNERFDVLRLAYKRGYAKLEAEIAKFYHKHKYWLEDYACFMLLKGLHGGKSFQDWKRDYRLHKKTAIRKAKEANIEEYRFWIFVQYQAYKQYGKLKAHAKRKGIQIIGDMPIYVSLDSADVWGHPKLFKLDQNRRPEAVAGVPPDFFSATGQLWGNPLYRWDYHKETGYAWWCKRLDHCFKMYDVVRIDHFRGFDEYFSIPYGAETAIGGHWEKGPGVELFRTVDAKLGEKQIIAEDLGFMTPTVEKLLKDSGYPGMKVLEFAFDPREKTNYLPHSYDRNCVVYTGTHDNETLVQWYKGLDKESKAFAEEYMNNKHIPAEEKYWDFVRLAMMSCANTCITPVQDFLGLDEEARINHPSTLGKNWKWRIDSKMLNKAMIKKIYKLTKISERLPEVEEVEEVVEEKAVSEEE